MTRVSGGGSLIAAASPGEQSAECHDQSGKASSNDRTRDSGRVKGDGCVEPILRRTTSRETSTNTGTGIVHVEGENIRSSRQERNGADKCREGGRSVSIEEVVRL